MVIEGDSFEGFGEWVLKISNNHFLKYFQGYKTFGKNFKTQK
jgi:hypothetical protein